MNFEFIMLVTLTACLIGWLIAVKREKKSRNDNR